MKAVRHFLPGSPESGVYAALANPAPPLAGPAAGRRPRRLSDKQRQTFLGTAAARIQEEARDRSGRWIRRLDCIHKSGVRTKQQRWDALAAMSEAIMARVDLATLALGWLDDSGAFRLNRQRGLAEDGGLTDCRVSRTLTDLATAGYIRRKVRRIYKNGQRWVCRVTIHLRPRFFNDLGLGHMLAEARTRKKREREQRLRQIEARKRTAVLQELSDRQLRRQSHKRAEGARRAAAQEQADVIRLQAVEDRQARFFALAEQHPDKSPSELRALLDAQDPPR